MWRALCLVVVVPACTFRPAGDAVDAARSDAVRTDACSAGCAIQPSCKAVLAATPGSPSGVYTIDPDGAGSGVAFEVACDMTTMAGGWTLVGRERLGTPASSAGPLQYLGVDSMNASALAADTDSGIIGDRFAGAYAEVLVVSGTTYFQFDRPAGFEMFGNTVNVAVDVTSFTTNDPTLTSWVSQAGGARLCVASRSNDVRPGDTSWAIKPDNDDNASCGCDSGSWTGRGAYYGGAPSGEQTVCDGWGGGWAGVKDDGVPKGGVAPTVETLIWIR